MERAFSHYFRDVRHLDGIDVYRILQLFDVTDPAIQHALKKLLVAGGRGAKDRRKDLEEAVVSIQRALEMMGEDDQARQVPVPDCGCNFFCSPGDAPAMCRNLPKPRQPGDGR